MKRYVFQNRIANADKKKEVNFNKQVHLRDDFRELWCRINQKTRYRVHFETAELVDRAINRLKKPPAAAPAPPPPPSREEQLLTEIRDLLAKR